MTDTNMHGRDAPHGHEESKKEGDYLIIGQGIAGTLLSYYLQQLGQRVVVVDDGNTASASKVASGVINPVTGKRLVRTWMIEELLPHAHHTYAALSDLLGKPLLKKCSILDFHLTQEQRTTFLDKQAEESDYLQDLSNTDSWAAYFRFNYGVGQISPALLVEVNTLIAEWRKHLTKSGSLLQERFSWIDAIVTESQITYKHVTARKIILCDGALCASDLYFNLLPWSKDKGEALIVSIPGLPRNNMYKQGLTIVPWRDDLFWVGATHDWKYTDMEPTDAFRMKTEEHLSYWLKLPYEVKEHIVAQRPANLGRKPFVGLHPLHPSIGIFNGLGTKGCSVGPYFAHQFASHLVYDTPLQPDVDVKRFSKILSR